MLRPCPRSRAAVLVLAAGTALLTGCTADPGRAQPGTESTPASPSAPSPSAPSPSVPSRSAPASPGPVATSGAPTNMTPTAAPAEPAGPSCAELAARLSVTEQIGQLLMVAIPSTGLGARTEATVSRTRAGSVILLGNSRLGRAGTRSVVSEARSAMEQPRGARGLVAVDQEGGTVQRLQGRGFDRIPSAQVQAELSDRELSQAAAGWGRQLEAVGIDANLAPVADVVPTEMARRNAPIGALDRGYGADPSAVAKHVVAFDDGMRHAGIATAIKHFPGLGRVRGNTDFSARVVDSVTTRQDPGLAGFAAAVEAGVPMVMMSSAVYSKIDAKQQAVFSETVITEMLRDGLDFGGVVISDDLSAEAVRDVKPGLRAVRFVQAGGDLVIVGDPAEAAPMVRSLETKADRDPAFADQIRLSAARVLALKAGQGRADCRGG